MLPVDTQVVVKLAGQSIQGISPTYSAVKPGAELNLIGSSGFLEIAVRAGNAAEQLGVQVGDAVLIEQM